MGRKLVVGITQGDGNGISYEVIIKALADERMLDLCTPVIYGSSKIFGFYTDILISMWEKLCEVLLAKHHFYILT